MLIFRTDTKIKCSVSYIFLVLQYWKCLDPMHHKHSWACRMELSNSHYLTHLLCTQKFFLEVNEVCSVMEGGITTKVSCESKCPWISRTNNRVQHIVIKLQKVFCLENILQGKKSIIWARCGCVIQLISQLTFDRTKVHVKYILKRLNTEKLYKLRWQIYCILLPF